MIVQQDINKAVETLRHGGLVAFPTETVYGLGADAKNSEALAKIFAAKGRPQDHPLIVHLAEIEQLSDWTCELPDFALQLAQAFWPGPLTLILKKTPDVSDLITGGQETIGIRMPSHPVAQALLRAFGSGLAAPSANRFGRISPTTAEAVREELGDAVDLILDGGQCDVGVESTIVDVTGDYPVILRPGMIGIKQIQAILHATVRFSDKTSPRVSGSCVSHYAPTTKTRVLSAENISALLKTPKPLAILCYNLPVIETPGIEWVSMSTDSKKYAHDLYATLRMLDKKNFQEIVIEAVPEDREWDAIRDRLQRATAL